MKLIFIYGPPAVGKLTVAEKLSEITKIPLFHNHLSRDIVKDIYEDKLNDHYDLVDIIRRDVISYCAQHDTDLIFTVVYGGSEDNDIVKSYIDIVESNGGEVVFIELTADREDLLKRVDNESRKRYKKLTDPETLKTFTESVDLTSIPFVKSLKINTSELTPEETAQLIADNLKS